jgi:hypothetical protein
VNFTTYLHLGLRMEILVIHPICLHDVKSDKFAFTFHLKAIMKFISLVTNTLVVLNIDRPEHNRGIFLRYFFHLRGVYIVTSHFAFLYHTTLKSALTNTKPLTTKIL